MAAGAVEVTLLSWNVAGRLRRLRDQAERVTGAGTGVVCLQEVSRNSAPVWAELLSQAGVHHVRLAHPGQPSARSRPLSVLTAARAPIGRLAVQGLPWPERVMATCVQGLEVVDVHSPTSARSTASFVPTAVSAGTGRSWH
jgi:exonuclease III